MTSLKTKITTPDVESTANFYERAFGMEVVEEWDEPGDKGVILGLGSGSREALLEIYHEPQAGDFSGISLQFKVDDVESFQSSLPEDLTFEGPVERPWGSTYVYLSDPNGISVIAYQGGW